MKRPNRLKLNDPTLQNWGLMTKNVSCQRSFWSQQRDSGTGLSELQKQIVSMKFMHVHKEIQSPTYEKSVMLLSIARSYCGCEINDNAVIHSKFWKISLQIYTIKNQEVYRVMGLQWCILCVQKLHDGHLSFQFFPGCYQFYSRRL